MVCTKRKRGMLIPRRKLVDRAPSSPSPRHSVNGSIRPGQGIMVARSLPHLGEEEVDTIEEGSREGEREREREGGR